MAMRNEREGREEEAKKSFFETKSAKKDAISLKILVCHAHAPPSVCIFYHL
jgi:hypothetical protein